MITVCFVPKSYIECGPLNRSRLTVNIKEDLSGASMEHVERYIRIFVAPKYTGWVVRGWVAKGAHGVTIVQWHDRRTST